MEQKSIYIILTRTSTVLSSLISYMTGDTYTHASIALEKDMSSMYSFGRKRQYNPFIGGFCQENICKGIFTNCNELPYLIIQIKVTDKQYDEASFLIKTYIQNTEQYSYNYLGLLFALVGKANKCSNRFYCSEFVYDLLRQCEIICEDLYTSIRPQQLIQYGEVIEEGVYVRRLSERVLCIEATR